MLIKKYLKTIQKINIKYINSGKNYQNNISINFYPQSQKSNNKSNGEIGELVNPDGSIIGSNIPILNQRNLAKKQWIKPLKCQDQINFHISLVLEWVKRK